MLNNVDNCQDCGKLASLRNGICNSCYQKEIESLDKVKKFLRRNKDADFKYTVEQTGVSEDKIKKFIEEGRILSSNKNFNAFNCQICNSPISKGTICDSCASELKGNEQPSKPKENKLNTKKGNQGFASFNKFD